MTNNFKFGNYLETRCAELTRMVHFKILNSVAIAAIAGSSVRDNIIQEAKDLEMDYAYFDPRHLTRFQIMNLSEHLLAAHDAGKVVIAYGLEEIIEKYPSVEKSLITILNAGPSKPGALMSFRADFAYSSQFKNVLRNFEFATTFHRK